VYALAPATIIIIIIIIIIIRTAAAAATTTAAEIISRRCVRAPVVYVCVRERVRV